MRALGGALEGSRGSKGEGSVLPFALGGAGTGAVDVVDLGFEGGGGAEESETGRREVLRCACLAIRRLKAAGVSSASGRGRFFDLGLGAEGPLLFLLSMGFLPLPWRG